MFGGGRQADAAAIHVSHVLWHADLHHNTRVINGLTNAGVFRLGQLTNLCPRDLKDFRNIGPSSIRAIADTLETYGLTLAWHPTRCP